MHTPIPAFHSLSRRARLGAWLVGLAAVTGLPVSAGDAPPLAVALPAGVTRLSEVGIYRVGWQSYGKSPVSMPQAWTGTDDASGIMLEPGGRVLGREAMLLHSPWRVPPGKSWVEYDLALPRATPITFTFGIAMRPDIARPDKSDGVTFSCQLTAHGATRELMRKHHDQGTWQDYLFDLSAETGSTVTLRLQVEPGPRNNPAFDFSYFGDAKLQVGETSGTVESPLSRLTATRAYRAVASSALTTLANTPAHGVVPSNRLPDHNSLEHTGDTWNFRYQGDDCRIVYSYTPRTGTLDDFTARVDDGPAFLPAAQGGVSVSRKDTDRPAIIPACGGHPARLSAANGILYVLWEYEIDGTPLAIAWEFAIRGKALVVSASSSDPRVAGFSLGEIGNAPLRKTISVPYLAGHIHYLPAQNAFACRYLDWTASHASRCPQGTATYEPRTDGTRNPLAETGYIAVSPDVDEVLPNIPHPPSPYLADLAPRVMLDIWGHKDNSFAADAAWLRELKDQGVDHLAIIQHVWQRYGYDVKLPDHLPANPAFGGDDGMAAFGRAANDCGFLWSVHENYIDLYPDAPSYNPAARVLQADGTPSPAWYNSGTRTQSYGLKCNLAAGFARKVAPEAHRRYGTTAAYLDVHTCVPPWHQLDHDASQPQSAMALAKVERDTALFQLERDAHHGPLFGEGANHFYWAGRCDGVEAQVAGGEDHAAFLDFDLLKIHPQMVNHGMGYLERWFRNGSASRYGIDAGTFEQLDKYRAMELAYGHAGFLGATFVHHLPSVAREHHLVSPVQRLYGNAKVTEIRYEAGGRLVSASAALVAGDTTRQRIRYESGLTLWVNWRAEPWAVEGRVLPQWGFLALGPDTVVGTTLHDGRIADSAECPEFLFADARTSPDLPYLHAAMNIEPRLCEFTYLGGNRIRVRYAWNVHDTLAGDMACFVHATNPNEPGGEHIVFQGDHKPARPTSQWRPGEVIDDGPYDITVSDKFDTYDLLIGLHGDDRVTLQGIDDGSRRIHIATLTLERKDGHITGIRSAAPKPADPPSHADFTAHTNPPGTWVDFGKIATDGAAKVNLFKDHLVLFPYPRDKGFRVTLDLKAIAPAADPSRVRVRALAASTARDLGPAAFTVVDGKLMLTAGMPGAGRYVISW